MSCFVYRTWILNNSPYAVDESCHVSEISYDYKMNKLLSCEISFGADPQTLKILQLLFIRKFFEVLVTAKSWPTLLKCFGDDFYYFFLSTILLNYRSRARPEHHCK